MITRSLSHLAYLRRWLPISIIIGIVAGLGAAIFFFLLQNTTSFFLNYLANYSPPLPAGEGGFVQNESLNIRWWIIPIVTTFGGIISGFLIYHWAPEAEGHGTDAVIESFHQKSGHIRRRVPFIKTLASVITIGSGGSAGREGPIAQIGAGFASWLASVLNLSEHDRRIMVISGTAAGIGSIFKAPLGGAIFAIEVLYMQDFEVDAIIPSFTSSVISYSVFCSIFGYAPIFDAPSYVFTNPLNLFFYAILGLLLAPIAIIYIKIFYGLRDKIFRKLKFSNYLKPALGGFALGLTGLFFPQILGTSYGWIQLAIYGRIALTTLLIIGIMKIIATSFTISSGGSGGVFAPSLVIGGMFGGVIGMIFNTYFPEITPEIGAFIIVGMAAFFAGAAHVPIAAMIMVAEMTGDYRIFIPAMLACAITHISVWRWTIYEKQVANRMESPAHRGEFIIDVLEEIPVKKVATERVEFLSPKSNVKELVNLVSSTGHLGYPVLENEKLVGIVVYSDLLKVPIKESIKKTVGEIMTKKLHVTYPNEDLASALSKMQDHGVGRLPVVDPHNSMRLLGILTRSDIIRGHEDMRHEGKIKRKLDYFDRITVEEVMNRILITVTPETTITQLSKIIADHGYQRYPVLDDGRLIGMVSIQGFVKHLIDKRKYKTVLDIIERRYSSAYEDESLNQAISKMYENKVDTLAVVDKEKTGKIVGTVSTTDIIHLYAIERLSS